MVFKENSHVFYCIAKFVLGFLKNITKAMHWLALSKNILSPEEKWIVECSLHLITQIGLDEVITAIKNLSNVVPRSNSSKLAPEVMLHVFDSVNSVCIKVVLLDVPLRPF